MKMYPRIQETVRNKTYCSWKQKVKCSMLIVRKSSTTCMNFRYPNTSPYEQFLLGNSNCWQQEKTNIWYWWKPTSSVYLKFKSLIYSAENTWVWTCLRREGPSYRSDTLTSGSVCRAKAMQGRTSTGTALCFLESIESVLLAVWVF